MSIILTDFNSFNCPFFILHYRHVIYNYAVLKKKNYYYYYYYYYYYDYVELLEIK